MKDRTLQILAALIEDFVETATPVASKRLLMGHKDFDVSSATIRNEFAILEEIGLIESPHVSAGKIPTEKGYRFFVDELLQDKSEEEMVTSLFQKRLTEYRLERTKESLFDALRIVASLSGNVAFANIENDKTAYLGLSNVLRSPEFLKTPEKVAQIIEVLEGQEKLQSLLRSLEVEEEDSVKIFIGHENMLEEISSCTMLVTRFSARGVHGHMGILGPIRMKYAFNRALLRNALEILE